MLNIAQRPGNATSVKGEDLKIRLYPNGEAVVWRQRRLKEGGVESYKKDASAELVMAAFRLYLEVPVVLEALASYMGLSLLANFDRLMNAVEIMEDGGLDEVEVSSLPVKQYGMDGITRMGARMVRNAAHLLQRDYGIGRLSFATVTLPNLSFKKLNKVQKNWHKVVELYRLNVSRELKRQGLPGEIVTVTEIQEKRFKKTGLPVLHLHSVWVGRLPYGGWAISTELHDEFWHRALRSQVKIGRRNLRSACNIQEVRRSAAGYLGKYMSKGSDAIKALVDKGFKGWVPKQWWNCTRTLRRRIDEETFTTSDFAELLMNSSKNWDTRIWKFVGHVELDIGQAQPFWLASYGRLNDDLAEEIRAYVREGG